MNQLLRSQLKNFDPSLLTNQLKNIDESLLHTVEAMQTDDLQARSCKQYQTNEGCLSQTETWRFEKNQ